MWHWQGAGDATEARSISFLGTLLKGFPPKAAQWQPKPWPHSGCARLGEPSSPQEPPIPQQHHTSPMSELWAGQRDTPAVSQHTRMGTAPLLGPKGEAQNAVGGEKCPRSPEPSASTWVGTWHCDPTPPACP